MTLNITLEVNETQVLHLLEKIFRSDNESGGYKCNLNGELSLSSIYKEDTQGKVLMQECSDMVKMDTGELSIGEQVWKEIKEEICEECELTNIAYRTWIEPLAIQKIEGESILIAAPGACSVEYVNQKYGKILRKKIEMKTGKIYKLDFVAMNDL